MQLIYNISNSVKLIGLKGEHWL